MPPSIKIAVDAMGSDRRPVRRNRRRRAGGCSVWYSHRAGRSGGPYSEPSAAARYQRPSDRSRSCQRSDHHGRCRGHSGAPEEGLFDSRRGPADARFRRFRLRQRRQHRRSDGDRQDDHGHAARSWTVRRLSTVLPTQKGKPAILLDVGANVDCKPHHLEQFAIMGDIYSRAIFGIRRPRVGLLSIGEEDSKGNELTKEAFKSLKRAPINFIGNVEGRDIFKGDVDVIVCDGFTGTLR